MMTTKIVHCTDDFKGASAEISGTKPSKII